MARSRSIFVTARSASPWLPRIGQRRLVVERVGHVNRPPGAAPQIVETEVDRQAVQPRPERRLAAEALQLPVRREEDLLEHVLRVGRVAQHANGHAVEPPRMRPVHLFERPQVALPAPFDQREVVLPGRSPPECLLAFGR